MNIYLANLSSRITSTDLWDMFSEIGKVQEVEIVRAADDETENNFAVVRIEAYPRKAFKAGFQVLIRQAS